ncbi:MAG: hypothetical protein V4528_04170 [Pseudomonadota bacterium]
MDGITDHNLLITQEAAALLQPYMRHQSAMNWLVHDRQRSPVIPFILLQGDYYYRERDLISFITHTLDAKARFIRINHLLHADHRKSPERRRKNERRKTKMITLKPGIERRQARNPDRRQSTDMDRRTRPSESEAKRQCNQ